MPSKPGERQRRPLEWNAAQQRALAAVLEGRNKQQKLAKIAEDCHVSDRTLRDWMAHPDFQARLSALRDSLLDMCDELGVAYVRKGERVAALSQMAEEARQSWEERRYLREYRPVLVKRPAETSREPEAEHTQDRQEPKMLMVEDYIITERLNEGAMTQFRQAMTEIAAEMGARKNVTELTGKDGEALPGLVINVMPSTDAGKAKYRRQGSQQATEDEALEASASDGSSSG